MTTKKSKRCESKRRVSKRRVYRRRGSKKRVSKRKSRRNLKKKYVGGSNEKQTEPELQTKLQELVDITHRIGQYYMVSTRTGPRILPHRSGGRNDKIIKAIKFLKGYTTNLDSDLQDFLKLSNFSIDNYTDAIQYLKDNNKKKISCDTNYLFFDESDGEVYINLYKVDDTFTYLKFPFFKDNEIDKE
jgi:hypothetical protein